MKWTQRLVPLFMLCVVGSASGVVLIVDPDGTSGTYLTIQGALNDAQDGDEIIVYPGTYYENIDLLGKEVWLHSAFGPEQTIIDGSTGDPSNRSCASFRSSEGPGTIIEGFRLQNGQGTLFLNIFVGGGAFCLESNPTIRDCEFINNSSYGGGAIYVRSKGPTVTGCVFRDNTCQTYGSAIGGALDHPMTISDCLFENNYAATADGTIHLTKTTIIEDCIFRGNQARAGAAVNSPNSGADYIVRRCTFEGNRAHGTHGGAIRVHEASATIEECLFVENSAIQDGGAILTIDGGTTKIRNCTFYRNYAERIGGTLAFWNGSTPQIHNNIIVESTQGGGVFCGSAFPTFVCNDAWSNAGGNYVGDCIDPTGSDGNISADPLFCAPEAGNFMLKADSPCAPDNNPECGLIGAFGVGCAATSTPDPDVVGGPRLLVGPNPFSGPLEIRMRGTPDTRGELRVEVYSPSGRRLLIETLSQEGNLLVWDGFDGSGHVIPSGVYYLRLLHGNRVLDRRSIVRID